jgi:hypothetical protein
VNREKDFHPGNIDACPHPVLEEEDDDPDLQFVNHPDEELQLQ